MEYESKMEATQRWRLFHNITQYIYMYIYYMRAVKENWRQLDTWQHEIMGLNIITYVTCTCTEHQWNFAHLDKLTSMVFLCLSTVCIFFLTSWVKKMCSPVCRDERVLAFPVSTSYVYNQWQGQHLCGD